MDTLCDSGTHMMHPSYSFSISCLRAKSLVEAVFGQIISSIPGYILFSFSAVIESWRPFLSIRWVLFAKKATDNEKCFVQKEEQYRLTLVLRSHEISWTSRTLLQ